MHIDIQGKPNTMISANEANTITHSNKYHFDKLMPSKLMKMADKRVKKAAECGHSSVMVSMEDIRKVLNDDVSENMLNIVITEFRDCMKEHGYQVRPFISYSQGQYFEIRW